MSILRPVILFITGLLLFCSCGKEVKDQAVEEPKLTMDTVEVFKVDLEVSHIPEDTEKAAEIDGMAKKLFKRHQFSGAILVAEKGKIIFEGSYGDSDYGNETPVTINTPFHLASVSKQFTAMSIMMLKEKGKLDYDDSIGVFFPDFPYKDITVRQLLNHTSGVPPITDYVPYFLQFWDSCKIATNQDLIYALKDKSPSRQFYPGRRFYYNNTGYIILARIVEKVSGENFRDFIRENIFQPLNMKSSFVYDIQDLNKHPDRALGYAVNRGYYYSDNDDIRNGLVGEKGIYSSAIDLYKWDRALRTEKLVKAETLKEAFTRGKLKNGREVQYGFGWRTLRKNNNLVYHFGHWRGFRSVIVRVLDDDKTIIILNNTSSRRLRYMVQKILHLLYDGDEPKL